MTLNPAERLAALRALEHGLKAAIDAATSEADEFRQQVRARSLETDWGSVAVARRKPSIRFDENRLVEWCDDNLPELVQRTVSPESQRWIRDKRFAVDGESVVDVVTGEEVEWATVYRGPDYLTVRLSPEAKADAVEAVTARVDLLAAALALPEAGQQS